MNFLENLNENHILIFMLIREFYPYALAWIMPTAKYKLATESKIESSLTKNFFEALNGFIEIFKK